MLLVLVLGLSAAQSTPSAAAADGPPASHAQWQARAEHEDSAWREAVQRLGERHPDTLRALHALAETRVTLGQTAEGLHLVERAAALRAQVLGALHRDTLESELLLARTLGHADQRQAQFARLQSLFRSSRDAFGERDPLTLDVQSEWSWALAMQARLAEASVLATSAVRISEQVSGPDHPRTWSVATLAADLQGLLGRWPEATAAHRAILDARLARLGERHVDTLRSMGSVATALRREGDLAAALAGYERAARLRTDVLGPRHPATLFTRHQQATLYLQLNRPRDAVDMLRPLLETRTAVLGEDHAETVRTMLSLGLALRTLGLSDESLRLQQRALTLKRAASSHRPGSDAAQMLELGRTLGQMGRKSDQLTMYDEALRLTLADMARHDRDAAGTPGLPRADDDPSVWGTMEQVAWDMAFMTPDPAAARIAVQVFDKTLAARRVHQGATALATMAAMAGQARLLVRAGQPGAALKLAGPYVQAMENWRNAASLADSNLQSMFAAPSVHYRFFALLHASTGQLHEAFRLAQLSKGRTLLEQIAGRAAGRLAVLPSVHGQALLQLESRLSEMETRAAEAEDPDTRNRWEAERNVAATDLLALQDRLRQQFPRYAQLTGARTLQAADLPGLLPRGAAGVEYLIHGDWVGAFVVDDAGGLRYRPLGNVPRLAETVNVVRRALSHPGGLAELRRRESMQAWALPGGGFALLDLRLRPGDGATLVTDLAQVTDHLSRRLLQPLAADLKRSRRWVLAPDGPLAALPFELLSFEGTTVLQAADVSYAQSLSVHALAQARLRSYRADPPERALLAVGHPAYVASGGDTSETRRAHGRAVAPSRAAQFAQMRDAWPPLPGTEREVRSVAALFDGGADLLLGADASEARLQQMQADGQLERYRYLLFAAHGHLSALAPSLSSIVLSQVDLAPGTDGHVTAAEWTGLRLRSELTVLSACDSGLGRVLPGEGVLGLPWAMFVAGNANAVVTLWPVDDEATARFVRDFFERLRAGQEAAAALAATKRAFAADPRHASPRLWAPFVLIGAG